MNIKNVILFLSQLFMLWLINKIGYILVNLLSLPIPGNVFGMLILFVLLLTGVIKLNWIDRASSFLLKHLVFFFIPITVGVMTLGTIFFQHGITIVIILMVSTLIGMISTGHISQLFLRQKDVA